MDLGLYRWRGFASPGRTRRRKRLDVTEGVLKSVFGPGDRHIGDVPPLLLSGFAEQVGIEFGVIITNEHRVELKAFYSVNRREKTTRACHILALLCEFDGTRERSQPMECGAGVNIANGLELLLAKARSD